MKLYTSPRAPNPRRVEIFLAEKGLDLETIRVEIGRKQHRTEGFAALNPLQRLPVLELDDGTMLSETTAICRYIEELHPQPPLFGADARERAIVEMWHRRVELNLFGAIAAAFRHLHPAMAELEVPQVPEWGEANKPRVEEMLRLLDRELASRPYIAGAGYTVADIAGLVAVDFLKPARLAVPEGLAHLREWHGRVSARPSARAGTTP